MPVPVLANTPAAALPADLQNLKDLSMLEHFAHLDATNPALSEVVLGPPLVQGKLWDIPASNPLTDQDPYFMRSQAWDTKNADCGVDHFCIRKDGGDLLLGESGDKALRLKQPLHAILETQEYVILSPDDLGLFAAKTPGEANPGEGFFYIDKADFAAARDQGFPVQIYFFPLPGSGWVGANRLGYENAISQEITIYNDAQFGLPVESLDLAMLAKTQRNNLLLLKTEAFLNGDVQANGVAYPPAHSTLAFGLFLSQPNRKSDKQADARSLERYRQIAANVGNLILPAAHALDVPAVPTQNEAIRGGGLLESTENLKADAAEAKKTNWSLKSYIYPGILYGGTGVLAAAAAWNHLEWGNLITADIYPRLKTVGAIMGATMAASITMKYTVHKEIFDKKYPKVEGQPVSTTIKNEAKGIFDELAHGLYFTFSGVAQGMRHGLDYLKDRFASDNKIIQKAWKETIEYDMRQNSKLAMNWKTFYYGAILFGMADAILVGVDLAIFEPWARNALGFSGGEATAAFATAEIMRNFLSYLMTGAHSYSHKVKTLHMDAAMREAKHEMSTKLKLDPEDPRNESLLEDMMNFQLAERYRAEGLPEKSEFLYDPLTFLEKVTEKAGFGIDRAQLTDDEQALLKDKNFVLKSRHWGLVQPALKRAIKNAERMQAESPSPVGAQVISTLRWAAEERSVTKTAAGVVWDTVASDWGQEAYEDAGHKAVAAYMTEAGEEASNLGQMRASITGKLKYMASESSQRVRDIRKVMFLMSNTGDRSDDLVDLFPESWNKKAGSREASLIAAELINRSFISKVQKDRNKVEPSAELAAKFGPRADAVLNRVAARDPALGDPFVRKVRREELMYRLSKRDERRDKLANYVPKFLEKGEKADGQWAAVRDRATAVYDRLADDDSAAAAWGKVADRFELKTGKNVDRESWVRSYRYRLIVAREFAQEVGITTNGMEDSDFIPKVVEEAAVSTEDILNQQNERIYQSKLSGEDLEFYRAQVFAQRFRSAYVKNSVASAPSEMSATSPEYPGIGQRVRRWLSPQVASDKFQAVRKHIVGSRVGRIASVTTRVFESFFRNEESAYDTGLKSTLERYVPAFPDIAKNGLRFARSMPYLLSFSYLANYYIWQIQMPYALWTYFITAGIAMGGVIEMNHRFQRFMDIKPMGDVPGKLSYAWWHSRLTNPEIMVVQGTAQPVTAMLNGAAGSVAGALMGCGRMLLGR